MTDKSSGNSGSRSSRPEGGSRKSFSGGRSSSRPNSGKPFSGNRSGGKFGDSDRRKPRRPGKPGFRQVGPDEGRGGSKPRSSFADKVKRTGEGNADGKRSFGDKRNFDGKTRRPDGDKRSFNRNSDRPQGERRSFDRKFDRSSGDDRRGFNKFGRDDRRGNDRGDRRDGDKRSFNRNSDRPQGERRSFDRKFDRSSGDDRRSFNKSGRDDRRGNDRGDRRDGDKRSFNRNSDRPQGERRSLDRKSEGRKPDFRKGDRNEASDGKRPIQRFENKSKHSVRKPDYDQSKFREIAKNKGREDKIKTQNETRLNKFIANAGICSRREADELISQGEIKVNGKVVTEMGYKVKKGDTVNYQGKVISGEAPVYILLNKPKDFITTTKDPEERRTVMELISSAASERVFPVGRLDRATTGLLLFTNDGELAEKLTHPSHKVQKLYEVTLDRPIEQKDFLKLEAGLQLEDGLAKPVDVALVGGGDDRILGMEIHMGRNRIVRRMMEHLGYRVEKLDRVMYAGLTKKDISRGQWRYLSEKEVIKLKFFI